MIYAVRSAPFSGSILLYRRKVGDTYSPDYEARCRHELALYFGRRTLVFIEADGKKLE